MDYRRIGQAGAIGLAGLAVLVMLWVGLAGLSLSDGDHCRDTEGSLLFVSATNLSADTQATVSDGGNGLCLLTNNDSSAIQVDDAIDGPGGELIAYDPATGGLLGQAQGGSWLLPETYEWRAEYAMAGSLAGRFLPVLAPVLALLALFAIMGLTWREYHS